MPETQEWWIVLVRDWGSVAILGDERQAEDFRVHKSRWERCPAWKVRLRDATDAESDECMAARDDESGIVSEHEIALPNDVSKARKARNALTLFTHTEASDGYEGPHGRLRLRERREGY